jgi:type II secretory pathway predicted ATPase ExeA
LKQRTALRCRLEPLSRKETQKYISLRLWLAGAAERHQSIFAAGAIDLIHEYSGGIPRLVNTICEAALISSFAIQSSEVAPEVIHEVAAEFCIPKMSPQNVIAGAREHGTDRLTRQSSAAV